MSKVEYMYRYRCPVCFIHWHETREDEDQTSLVEDEPCAYCKGNNFHLRELIDRQVDILDFTLASDFPKIIQNMWRYIRGDERDVI